MAGNKIDGSQIALEVYAVATAYRAQSSNVTITFLGPDGSKNTVIAENIASDKLIDFRLRVHKIISQFGGSGVSFVAAPVSS